MPSVASGLGWRSLEVGPGEGETPTPSEVVCRLIHLSDSHVCDAQSPARLEYLDRFADPHVTSDEDAFVGTYRAHEMLSTQTLDALVRATNRWAETGPIDAVLVTGDATDNAQRNELEWFITTLSGGLVRPDSGTAGVWEGVGGLQGEFDPSYWYPDGSPTGHSDDYPHTLYGFPRLPGLLSYATTPFRAEGLLAPWLSVYGNHDALLQGTVPAVGELRRRAVSGSRPTSLPDTWDYSRVAPTFGPEGPATYPPVGESVAVSADLAREILTREEWVDRHCRDGANHGPSRDVAGRAQTWWSREINGVLLVGLDTVNPHGGWEGSLDDVQLAWLEDTLEASTAPVVVLSSHHPPHALTNLYSPDGSSPRRGVRDVLQVLSHFPAVHLWLAGHRHRHRIEHWREEGHFDFWLVETSSVIDWPQQGRSVTLTRRGDEWAATFEVLDHLGGLEPRWNTEESTTTSLGAGWSRLLALNAWQRRRGGALVDRLSGDPSDRNVTVRWST